MGMLGPKLRSIRTGLAIVLGMPTISATYGLPALLRPVHGRRHALSLLPPAVCEEHEHGA